MIRDVIATLIRRALDELSLSGDFTLEHPADLSHGDYATNAALVAAKRAGKGSRAVAEELVRYLVQNMPERVAKVEVAGPGFINFHLSKIFFTDSISRAVDAGGAWGRNDALRGVKTVVEYTDPNPFKEFHIGHLMPNTIGESISRLLAFSGAEVKRANYQGDVGLHVAKAVWGLMERGVSPASTSELGKAYALGATAYESDADAKRKITDINKKIYERSDARVNGLYDAGRALSLDYFETVYRLLGTTFDYYFFESEAGPVGSDIVRKNGTVFEESDGAFVFRGEKVGLHTRVFVNSEGLPTYEAKELGLAKLKFDRYPYDLSVVVTGNEVVEYFEVLLAAMREVFPELAEKTRHVPHGMMRLPAGKMSSRTGNVIPALDLIREVAASAKEKMRASDVEDTESVAERVAVGAIKYSILRQGSGKDTVFDFDRALSLEGDSGPYLMYALARALSILRKVPEKGLGEVTAPAEVSGIERLLYRFPEVVERAAFEYEPHYVTTYLTTLAGAFNSWYARTRILDASDESAYRVLLTRAFATTMKNGLWLLGIPAPERM